MRVFLSAGEASGDQLGARLIDALQRRTATPVDTFGMGGTEMHATGIFRALRTSDELSVVGLFEVLRHLPRLFSLLDDLAAKAIEERPDVAVLIDVPDFNLRLARKLTAAGIPVVFYVAPTVWAWRPGRVNTFRPHIRRMLALYPFEAPIWIDAGVDTVAVGHPLLDQITAPAPLEQIAPKTIALLPGSRESELNRHLRPLLGAAERLRKEGLADRFVLPVAPNLSRERLERELGSLRDAIELVSDQPGSPRARWDAVARAEIALVASGTATLETALLGRPQVIFYRLSWATWILGRPFLRVKHVGLPNLIAGREIAVELLQGKLTAESLATEARKLLTDPAAREGARMGAQAVREALGPPGAAERAAEAVLEVAAKQLPAKAGATA